MGDGLMAIFGAPIEHDNDCQLAVNAALEIHKELKRRSDNGIIPETVIRIGINAVSYTHLTLPTSDLV